MGIYPGALQGELGCAKSILQICDIEKGILKGDKQKGLGYESILKCVSALFLRQSYEWCYDCQSQRPAISL